MSAVSKYTNSISPNAQMPILNRAYERFGTQRKQILSGISIIISQHLLPTILPLFEKLIMCGVDPAKVHIVGKIYSSVPSVVSTLKSWGFSVQICDRVNLGAYERDIFELSRSMWKTFLTEVPEQDPVIIFDHGGFLRRSIPPDVIGKRAIVGIEHTSKGLFGQERNLIPIINQARSRPKLLIEPGIIVNQALESLELLSMPLNHLRIGVIGTGAIGAAACTAIAQRCGQVSFYDQDLNAVSNALRLTSSAIYQPDLEALVVAADLIIGCTGRDCLNGLDFKKISGQKIFASLSSSDVEFATLLAPCSNSSSNSVEPIIIKGESYELTVLYGGFPINFLRATRDPISNDIDSTRALTFLSILQAAHYLRDNMLIPFDADYAEFLTENQ